MMSKQDVFFKQIPPDEKIYMPLTMRQDDDNAYETSERITAFMLGHQPFLYGAKEELLKQKVSFDGYEMPILWPAPLKEEKSKKKMGMTKETFDWPRSEKENDTYIGVITTCECVHRERNDYDIVCWWQQEEAEQGQYDIGQTLVQKRYRDDVTENDELSKVLNIIAGEWREVGSLQQLIRKKPQIVIGQVKSATPALQQIYSPDYSKQKILFVDLLIGAMKLLQVARLNKKYLVLLLPYTLQLCPHEGNSIYEKIVSWLTSQADCLVVVPAGDEGDKRHHLEGMLSRPYEIELSSSRRAMQMSMFFKCTTPVEVMLKNSETNQVLSLNKEGHYNEQSQSILTTGWQEDPQSGYGMMRWQIVNPSCLRWRLMILPSSCMLGSMTLWMEEHPKGENNLSETTYTMTVNGLTMVPGVISVGAYYKEGNVTLAFSGRGKGAEGKSYPDCVADDSLQKENMRWSGTLVSAARVATCLAYLQMQKDTKLTSYIAKNRLRTCLGKEALIAYPHEAQGYGIFDKATVSQMLRGM